MCQEYSMLTDVVQCLFILISKYVIFGITQFVQTGLTSKLNHRRWPTHQNDGIIARWRMCFNHVRSDETRAVFPIWKTKATRDAIRILQRFGYKFIPRVPSASSAMLTLHMLLFVGCMHYHHCKQVLAHKDRTTPLWINPSSALGSQCFKREVNLAIHILISGACNCSLPGPNYWKHHLPVVPMTACPTELLSTCQRNMILLKKWGKKEKTQSSRTIDFAGKSKELTLQQRFTEQLLILRWVSR